jgi:hypothetical protein
MELLDRISRAKYWLFDLVCVGTFPIHILIIDDLTLVVNKQTEHGLTYEELVDTLYSLFEEGMLIADLFHDSSNFPIEINPTRQDIENALARKMKIQYGLTPLGGKQWENFYKPNWNLYIYCCCHRDSIVLKACHRHILEKYLNLLPYSSQKEVVSGSEVWEPLVPWQATYWKTLPSGWQVACKTRETDEYLGQIVPTEYQEWLDQIYNWYTNPFVSNN